MGERLVIIWLCSAKVAKFMPDLTAGNACFYTKTSIFVYETDVKDFSFLSSFFTETSLNTPYH
jgi:hypothetical protein